MVEYSLVDKKYSIEELEDYISNNTLSDDDWYDISMYQKLSEPFIERYSDKVNWVYIIMYQSLSYEFLEKHLYKYSLNNYSGKNNHYLDELRVVYSDKYDIDKL